MRMMVAARSSSSSLVYSALLIVRWADPGVFRARLAPVGGVGLLGGKENLFAKKYCVLDVSLSEPLPLGMRSELE